MKEKCLLSFLLMHEFLVSEFLNSVKRLIISYLKKTPLALFFDPVTELFIVFQLLIITLSEIP